MAKRMRQANVKGGRPVTREVKLTEFEDNALYFAAAKAGMTPARFLKESALSRDRGISVAERHEMILSLHKIQAALAAIGNNINQLARHANAEDALTKEISAELTHSLTQVRATMQRTGDAVSSLAVSPDEADAT
ncbi:MULTISPECIES: plasmid mobilization relaxosome protein MobC [unclassified Nesterenkonia]|uniref:plasmid mobilization protein n=1 Tax=unclassified Nesterenkonia TaxID=2629769 RepID=UPI0021056FBD|nr:MULTISPECIES: plasmid mobilization relaxosome protein MobC [unclassified Nesterenkonia]